VQLLVGICILIVFAMAAVWVVDKLFIYLLARSYVEDVADVLNLNKYLAQAIAFAVFLATVYFVGKTFSLSRTSRRIGYLGIVALLIGHSLLLWHGTKDQYFEEQSGKAKAIKCYVLTREGKVHFLEVGHGIDPETGLPCRDVTPTVVERLNAYEKGKRPERVVEEEPIFFDARTGEPIIWFWMAKSGEIELFNLMGFNPENGEELKPVTSDVVVAYKTQDAKRKEEAERLGRPPRRVDPNEFAFFDSASGKPQVWYWRGQNGEYEFYDNQGFHPLTGEALKIIDRNVIAAWKQDIAKRQQEQQRRERDLIERQEGEKQEQERTQQLLLDKRLKEQRQIERRAQSGVMCDQAAANPADRRKPSNMSGVSYEELKGNATEALDICQVAMDTFPDELRYKYQYARALDFSDPDKSIRIYRQLTRQKYPAAFDNLGSLLLHRKDYSGAIAVFKDGAQLDDPDSIVSLADLIQRGYVRVGNPEAARFALLSRAAQLGHQGAQRAVEEQKLGDSAETAGTRFPT
jgi:hypothetical protein